MAADRQKIEIIMNTARLSPDLSYRELVLSILGEQTMGEREK